MLKKLSIVSAALTLCVSASWGKNEIQLAQGVQKAPAIWSNTLIDEAPEGEVVTGVRTMFSYWYNSEGSHRDFYAGVVGEYVKGKDGKIYLFRPCYTNNRPAYLTLDKVNDTLYVAHTPQLIWVEENSDGSIFKGYATRMIHEKYSANSFGYVLDGDESKGYNTDIYFIYKDGRLSQKNSATVEMNGEYMPKELIAIANSTGGWYGFGDGCLSIGPAPEGATLPEGAKVVEKSLNHNLLNYKDIDIPQAVMIKTAEVGNDYYISYPGSTANVWAKGTIDRTAGTVTFTKQSMGLVTDKNTVAYLLPATVGKYKDVIDEEENWFEWKQTFAQAEKVVFNYNNGNLQPVADNAAIYFSQIADSIYGGEGFANPALYTQTAASVKPRKPFILKFEKYDEFWELGAIGFAVSTMGEDGSAIPASELYINLYGNKSTAPYEFKTSVYDVLKSNTTDLPLGISDGFDLRFLFNYMPIINFFEEWDNVGVQIVQKHEGTVTRSEIVYADANWSLSGVESVVFDKAVKVYKTIENGRIIIVRDGKKYNLNGVCIE